MTDGRKEAVRIPYRTYKPPLKRFLNEFMYAYGASNGEDQSYLANRERALTLHASIPELAGDAPTVGVVNPESTLELIRMIRAAVPEQAAAFAARLAAPEKNAWPVKRKRASSVSRFARTGRNAPAAKISAAILTTKVTTPKTLRPPNGFPERAN